MRVFIMHIIGHILHFFQSLKEEGEESSPLHEYLRLKSAIVEARSAIASEVTEIQQLSKDTA